MPFIDDARQTLLAWLDSRDAWSARRALESAGANPDVARRWLREVTDDPASARRIAAAVADARARGSRPDDDACVEQWLLVRQGLDALDSTAMASLGDSARRLTCGEIASFADNDPAARKTMAASQVRFREFAKIVTGRRFCAGMFHWDECGIRRTALARVPPRDWLRLGRTLFKTGGIAPMMYPHLNPRRSTPRIEEPALSVSLAVLAESLEQAPRLRGLCAASWLWSPDTHRVSPHLSALNAPIVAHGGFVTIAGRASADCGVFSRSETRRRLYAEGTFTPTIGLVLWPRDDMLQWWRERAPSPAV
jgi:hypothetical protein